MKSILGRLGMGLAVFLTLSTAGHAQFTYTTNVDNTLTITGYSGGSASVSIPSNISGRTVTRLGDDSLRDSLTMTSVVIPDSITNIGARAFYTCTKLTGVAIPNSVTRLGNMAFMDCYNLSTLSLGSGITSIEDETYRNCTNLLSVTIPESVASIGANAFTWCLRMTNLTLGTGLKNIYGYAFQDCDSLKSITIPGSMPNSGFGAFAYCDSLRNVIIENGVKTIGEWSFLGCGALTNVIIPSSVTKIDNGAFAQCTNLRDTTIPSNVTVIGGTAFAYCSSIKNVTIPDAVTGLGGGAFQNCTALTNVAISANVRILSNGVFSACSSLKHIAIPNSVRNIEDFAFMSCTGLTNVLVGSGVTNLGISVFNGCGALRGAYFSGNAPSYGLYVFDGCVNATVYRLEGATGWPTVPNPWAGRPTAYWSTATLSINPTSTNLSNAAASGKTIGVTASAAWTAVSNVSWITITGGASGTSNGLVTFNVATNPATSRTGGIVVAGSGISLTCTVVQAGVSAPSAPTGVAATDGSYPDKVQVTWSASSGAMGYEVWRFTSNNSNSSSRIAQGIGGSPYNDTTVIAGTNYYYWVKATNAGGTSLFSNVDSGYASNSPPVAPTGVSASVNFSDRIRVSWTASTGATGYAIWRSTNNTSGSATNIASNIVSNTYDDSTVPQGITHYYWVKATNASGASGFSALASGLRTSTSFDISGTISYGGAQTGNVFVTASPHLVANNNIALSLDGVDDHVYVQNPSPALQLTNRITICAWVCVTGQFNGTYSTILVKLKTSPSPLSYVMAINNSDGKPYVGFGDGANYNATVTLGQTNGWTHLAFTHDGTVGRWYINGQYNSATTSDPIHRYGDGPFSIGAYVPLETYFNKFPGQLDDVALWTNVLTQGQIQSVMTNGVAGSEPGLVACWNFDDGTANDLTTNANHGQFMAGATTAARTESGPSYSRTVPTPGAYSITNVLAGEYDISAYRDSNGNGMTEPWEAYGTYPSSPLAVTGNMANINITLQDPITDTDDDGVTDYDEIYLYGSSWTNSDTDADGMPDGDEVLAGSSPTDDASMFGFADTQPVPEGGGVAISWPSLSNRVYRLERSTNLLLGFEPYADSIPADPPMNTYTDETPNVLGAYKVGVRME